MSIVDKFGLVNENNYMVLFFPATRTALIFRVVSRVNRGFEVFDYGPLPITTNMTLSSYDGGAVTPPADGVLPARSYTTSDITFPAIPGTPLSNVRDTTDMWYLAEEDSDRLFHVKMFIYPPIIRAEVRIPTGVSQAKFQKERVTLGIDTVMGFSRGMLEFIRLPGIRYGFRFGNDTNLHLYTFVRFVFSEYVVEVPKEPTLIYDLLTRRLPSYWITMPVMYLDPAIQDALRRVYGFTEPYWGFRLYGVTASDRDKAIKEYQEVIKMLRS
jgi:hypothetical protein